MYRCATDRHQPPTPIHGFLATLCATLLCAAPTLWADDGTSPAEGSAAPPSPTMTEAEVAGAEVAGAEVAGAEVAGAEVAVADVAVAEVAVAEVAVAEVADGSPTAQRRAPQGSLIFVDPVSGELTSEPTVEQEAWWRQRMQQLGKQRSHAVDEPPRPFPLQGGGEGVFLGDSAMSATVIRRLEDGSWAHTCSSGEHALDHPPHGTAGPQGAEVLQDGDKSPGDGTSFTANSAPVM